MNLYKIFFILLIFCGCYKESDYEIDSDKSKDLFQVNISRTNVIADNFSTVQLTVVFDKSVDSIKALTKFKTTSGIFVESNSTNYIAIPKYNYDSSKLISTVTLRSPLTIDNTIVSIQVAGFTKSISVKFNRSYPEFIMLSANTLSLRPKNNEDGEVIFTNKIFKTFGFPSIGTKVDLYVVDSTYQPIGCFRTYVNETDANGNTTYTFVLGDSVANGLNYLGKLYAISKVQSNENPIEFKRDTLILFSTK